MTSPLSPFDDYPIHQSAEVLRHPATSDRNFYDRYYNMLHDSAGGVMLITGFGQYPNLSVQDAFVLVRRGTEHRVVRASRPMGNDRMDTSVGPFSLEVIEGLKRVRFVLEPNEHGVSFDLTFTGSIAPHLEPRHYIRQMERITFDTQRFAQTGFWSGHIVVDDDRIEVDGPEWKGTRDRSWGVRPVGEPEPPGILAEGPFAMSMWNYDPIQFDDYSIVYMCSEKPDGTRDLETAKKIWCDPDRPVEHLGRPEHEHEFIPGTRRLRRSRLSFPQAPDGPLEIEVSPLIEAHIGIGTGYAPEPDWKHGMYHGPEVVVQGVALDVERDSDRLYGIVDAASRFETSTGDIGYGLHEYMFLGEFPKYGLTGILDGAP